MARTEMTVPPKMRLRSTLAVNLVLMSPTNMKMMMSKSMQVPTWPKMKVVWQVITLILWFRRRHLSGVTRYRRLHTPPSTLSAERKLVETSASFLKAVSSGGGASIRLNYFPVTYYAKDHVMNGWVLAVLSEKVVGTSLASFEKYLVPVAQKLGDVQKAKCTEQRVAYPRDNSVSDDLASDRTASPKTPMAAMMTVVRTTRQHAP